MPRSPRIDPRPDFTLPIVACACGLLSLAAAPPRPASLEGLDPMVASRIETAWTATEQSPEDAGRWLALGRVYHAHQLVELARDCYLRSTELAPADARAWYSLAHAGADLGDLESAIADAGRAAELAPGYAPAHWRRGDWLLELGREVEAEAAFQRAIRTDEMHSGAPVGLARILVRRGEAREAIPILQAVLARDPTNGVAGQLLGSALRSIGEERAARRTLALATGMGAYFPDPWHEEILDTATGVGNRLRLASARLARGETDRVVAELEALRHDHPKDVGLLNKLAEAYLVRGEVEAALAALEPALVASPTEFATLIHLAQAEQRRGELAAALAWAERAIAANPHFWQGHFTRAGILHRARRFRDCLLSIEAAMERGAHQSPDVWLMEGDAHLQLGEWAEAARAFEAASSRFPFLGQAFVGLAFARVETGDFAGTRAALDSAAELQGEDGTMRAIRARLAELEAGGRR